MLHESQQWEDGSVTDADMEMHMQQHEEQEHDAAYAGDHPPLHHQASASSRGAHARSESGSHNQDDMYGSSHAGVGGQADPTLAGRTSVQANKLLVEMFESFSDGFHTRHPFHPRRVFLRSLLLHVNSLSFLLVLALLWASYGWLRRVHMLVECCILSVNWILNALLDTYLQYLTHTEMLRLLRARMELVLDLPPLAETRTTEMPPSSTFVRTLRDGIWRPLPMNLLVAGDVIELDPDDRMPCPVRRVILPGTTATSAGQTPVGATVPLAQTAWSSQTQILAHHASHSAKHASGDAQAQSLPPRTFSDLSAIVSNSAGERSSEQDVEVATLSSALRTRPSEGGIEMASRAPQPHRVQFAPSVQVAPGVSAPIFATASVASSYSATPSPVSSMASHMQMQPQQQQLAINIEPSPAPLQVAGHDNTSAAAAPLPPPPPPPPPAVPSPGDMSDLSMSGSDGSSPEMSAQQGGVVRVHMEADNVAGGADATHDAALPQAAPARLSVPDPHHIRVNSLSPDVSGAMSPESSMSAMSALDPELVRQTDTTFLPATVLQPLVQQQYLGSPAGPTTANLGQPLLVKTDSIGSSNASTLAGGDDRGDHSLHDGDESHTGGGIGGGVGVGMGAGGLPGLFSSLADEAPRHYIVEESPLRPQLEFILQPRSVSASNEAVSALGSAGLTPQQRQSFLPPTNTFLTRFNYVQSKQPFVLLAFMLLYWLLVFVRLGLNGGRGFQNDEDTLGSHTYEYLWWVLYSSALLSLPLLNLSNSFWLFVLDTLGNSVLLVTQEAMQDVYDDELNNNTASSTPNKSTANLFSTASRKRAMKRRQAEAAKAKARAAARKKSRHRGLNDADGDNSSESSVSSVSSASTDSADSDSTVSSRGSEDDELDEDAHTYAIVDTLNLSVSSIIRHGWDIMTGREFYITRNVNPLQVLGGVTVFCCLDNEGILSENEPSADHICFLTQPPGAQQHQQHSQHQHQQHPQQQQAQQPTRSSSRPHQHRHHHHHHSHQPKVMVLDLMNDPESANGIVIEGDSWHQHLNSLKPLGLNSILNNACNLPQSMLSSYEFSSTEPTTVTTTSSSSEGAEGTTTTTTNSQESASSSSDADSTGLGCLCMLGREIGFDVHFIRQQYYIGKVIYTVAVQNTTTRIRPKRKNRLLTAPGPKALSKAASSATGAGASAAAAPDLQILSKIHTMTSMSVQDRFQPSSLHLLTNGDPYLVLFHSTHFWNGTAIQPLSDQIRTQLLGIYQQWSHQDLKVLAFSYSPIFPPSIYNYLAMFNPAQKVEYVIENLNEELDARHRAAGQAAQQAAAHLGHAPAPSMSAASSSNSLSAMSDGSHDLQQQQHGGVGVDASMGMGMPPRRRYATEHSTIDEAEEDPATMSPRVQHPQQHNSLHDHEHELMHHHLHDDEHSHHSQASQHGLALHDEHQQQTAMHEIDAEYSRSYSHRSHSGYHPHNDSAATYGSRNVAPFGVSHPPPPPPPAPPAIPTPARDDDESKDQQPQASLPSDAGAPADGSLSVDAELPSFMQPVASVSSLPVAPVVLSSAAAAAGGHTQVTLEMYTPRARKHSSGANHGSINSSGLVKSQSFPSSFVPHVSLGSMLPGSTPETLLQSNLGPPIAPPARSDSMPPIRQHADMDSNASDHATSYDDHTTGAAPSGPQAAFYDSASQPLAPPLSAESDLLRNLQSSQIFLGMIAMRDQPKIEVRALVEDMKNAGIRFVFFSPDNERKTQAFGAKIGLNTDWNFYVSLRDPEQNPGSSVRRSQGKSQLPCGVSAIRNHLQTVDNVPLLVSLFTDCEPSSCREMIRIYQDAGDVVMCMGSSLKVDNSMSFMQADISASLDPMPAKQCPFKTYRQTEKNSRTHKGGQTSTYQQVLKQYQNAGGAGASASGSADGGVSNNDFTYSEAREFAASSAITSMPCALLLSATTDLHHFMALICEGRRLLHCMTQCLSFCAAAYLTLALVLLANFAANCPPILVGYQLLWLIWLVIPLLSLSLLNTPRELDLMRGLPDKNQVSEEGLLTVGGLGMMDDDDDGGVTSGHTPHLDEAQLANHNAEYDDFDADDDDHRPRPKPVLPGLPRRKARPLPIIPDLTRYIVYYLLRFAPSAFIYLALFLWLLHASADSDALRDNFYWSSTYPRPLFNDSSFQSLLLVVQNYSLVVFVAALAVHSMGFVYRYDSVKNTSPFKNRLWLGTAVALLVCQILFCIVSVYSVSVPAVDVVSFRWYVFLPWPLLIIAMDELCKRHDRARRDFLHKKARQHFDTVLGMHSPK